MSEEKADTVLYWIEFASGEVLVTQPLSVGPSPNATGAQYSLGFFA